MALQDTNTDSLDDVKPIDFGRPVRSFLGLFRRRAAAEPAAAPAAIPHPTNWDEVGEMFAGMAPAPRRR